MTPWPVVELGKICEFKYGKSLPAAKRVPGDFPVYGSNGMVGNHTQAVTSGPTIVIGRKGSFGEVHLSERACWPIDTTYYVDSSCTDVDLRWLAHLLPTLRLTELNRAAAIPGLNREDAYRRTLLLPPLDEQRRIATILDRADALDTKRHLVLDHLDELVQSLFFHRFGDPTLPGAWRIETVEQVAAEQKHAIVDGPFGTALKPSDYEEAGIPVIRIKNISRRGELRRKDLLFIRPEKFEMLRRSSLQAGDVLVSRVGTLGNTCVFPPDFGDALLSTTGVCKVTTNRSLMIPEFMHAAFRTPSFQRQIERSASTSVQKYFNLSALRGWRIIVPPLADQIDFVDRLARLQVHRELVLRQFDVAESLRASLQDNAFAGAL